MQMSIHSHFKVTLNLMKTKKSLIRN